MYKVVQTWGPKDTFPGEQATAPREFETLVEVEAYLEKEMDEDKEYAYDVIYTVFEKQWVEKKFETGFRWS